MAKQQQPDFVIITDYATFDFEKLEFSKPTKFNVMQLSWITYGGKKLHIKTPGGMHCPFGMNSYNNGEKLSVGISFRGHDEDPEKAAFLELLYKLDARIRAVPETDPSWFGGQTKSAAVLEETYNKIVKVDPKGNYAPTVRVNCVTSGGNNDTRLYGEDKTKELPIEPGNVPKGSTCTALITFGNVWIMGNKFGVSPKIKQMRCLQPSNSNNLHNASLGGDNNPLASGYSFISDSDSD